jgi:hypothetical protein
MRPLITVAALGHDVRELLAKEAKPLTYRNAMLQEKAADRLICSESARLVALPTCLRD